MVKKDKKDVRLQVRLNSKEKEMLEYVMEKTGETKSKIILEGLRMKYNLAKYQ